MKYLEAYIDGLWIFLGINLEITQKDYHDMLNVAGTTKMNANPDF